MKKSKEVLLAEQIVATILRKDKGDAAEMLREVKGMANDFKYGIAQRVTTAIFLATLYDSWEDFTKEDVNEMYKQYMAYHESYKQGNEDIFRLMVEIDKMVGGDLLSGKLYEIVKEKGNAQDEDTN